MMRAMKKYLCLFVLLMVVGCQHHYQYPPILQEADSLCVAQPDSAIALLKSISTEMQQAPEYVQKRYQLLTIKANDKAYITHTSDSLILSLVDYYEHGGDKDFLGEAYYYAGSTYRDLGDAPRALEYYQKALDAMPGDENLKVKSKVYAQMGDLLSYQDLTGEALLKYKQSYYYEKTRNDTAGMVYSLRDIGYTYRRLDNIDSAFYYYKKAESISSSFGDIALSNLITSQIAALYSEIGMYDSAKYYLQPSLEHLSRTNFSSIYSIASNLYYRIGQYDSVHYYDSELLKYGNQQAKLYAYYKQARIASLENKYEDAISLMTDFFLLNDSIQKTVDAETLSRMNALYNYQIREKENHELEVKNNRSHMLLLLLTIFVLVVVLLCAYFILQHRNRRIRAELFIERLKQVQEKVYRESADMLAVNNKKIASLEHELEQMRLEGTTDNQKETIKRILENENENLEMKLQIKESADMFMHTSLLRNKLRERAKVFDEIRDEEWKDIESFLNTNYPEFLSRLQTVGDLNKSEYRTCLLLKCQLSPSEIAALLNLTSGGVANIRRRLSQRILLQSKNPSDWDQFIHSL